MSDPTQNTLHDPGAWQLPPAQTVTPAYTPPALAIRASYTVGEASHEVVVEADQLPDNPGAFVAEVLAAMSTEYPGAATAIETAGTAEEATR